MADIGAETTWTLTGLSAKTDYRVQVRAVGRRARAWSESATGARTTGKAPLTAVFDGMPAEHDGARPFAFEIVFSEEFYGLSVAAFTDGALEVGNGRVVDAKRTTPGENRRVTVRVRPASGRRPR